MPDDTAPTRGTRPRSPVRELVRAWLAGWLPGRIRSESGSLVTEYGLIAIVGATLAGVAIQWASGGAVAELFTAILTRVRNVVGA